MKLSKKSEWFAFDKPIGEPDVIYTDPEYHIERLTQSDGVIIWFGLNTNWKKEPDSNWSVLTINEKAKPLKKYLPDIVYGEDRTYWKPCDIPIYEIEYIKNKFNNEFIDVDELLPEQHVEVLALSPDNKTYLTSYRPAYDIFTCQNKSESISGWKWKYL